jgi:cellulase/cellobiase CelA1
VLLAVAGAVALLGSVVVPAVTAHGAAPACTVEYTVTNQWGAGFQGDVKVINNQAPLSSWSLTFDLPGGQEVTRGWNAEWSQSGTTVTAANESWNGSLGTGASVSAGFLASWSGSNRSYGLSRSEPGQPHAPNGSWAHWSSPATGGR